MFDFDSSGRLTGALFTANGKKANPVASDLAAWVQEAAGPGSKNGRAMLWVYGGFRFRLMEKVNAGEDSVFEMRLERRRLRVV